MNSFFGYACTELGLHNLAQLRQSSYAGYENAPTEVTWELQEEFDKLGPFRLMTAKINGEIGYIFAVGMDDITEEQLPIPLLLHMEAVFGGGPLCFKHDPKQGKWMFTSADNVIEVGTIVTSNLRRWKALNHLSEILEILSMQESA